MHEQPLQPGDCGAIPAGYGTYVMQAYSTAIVISDCSNASVLLLKFLVYSSWAMIAFNW